MIRIRVDDFPTTKPSERHKHSNAAFDVFDRIMQEVVGKKYLLGVIPDSTSDEDLKWLSKKNLVIGMHGLDHDETKLNDLDGLSAETAMKRLHEQRSRFQSMTGQEIETYLPPHNVIDDFSLAQLKGAGFTSFTSGPGTSDNVSTAFLKRIDSRGFCYGRSDELLVQDAHQKLREASGKGQNLCLTLHWTWENNLQFATLRPFLQKIAEHVDDWDTEK